jgi:two-component system, chemotaxis family, protein-glutamate methylesterase/glutaminase
MEALPGSIARDRLQVTGISCPDCHGVLGVRAEGRHAYLVFECRVHHSYDLTELLAAKEERLDDGFWWAIRQLDELAALLGDLVDRGRNPAASEQAIQAFRERAGRLRAEAKSLRDLVRANDPIDLSQADPGTPAAP